MTAWIGRRQHTSAGIVREASCRLICHLRAVEAIATYVVEKPLLDCATAKLPRDSVSGCVPLESDNLAGGIIAVSREARPAPDKQLVSGTINAFGYLALRISRIPRVFAEGRQDFERGPEGVHFDHPRAAKRRSHRSNATRVDGT